MGKYSNKTVPVDMKNSSVSAVVVTHQAVIPVCARLDSYVSIVCVLKQFDESASTPPARWTIMNYGGERRKQRGGGGKELSREDDSEKESEQSLAGSRLAVWGCVS